MTDRQIPDDDLARSATRKAIWRILPLLILAYLVAYTDRVNVSFAARTMNADLGFSATVYGLGGGLFFLGYALFEVPSNLILVRVGARPWIARIMITWGLIGVGMMLVKTPMEFYAVRFLLGVAEAGFFPGVMYYLSHWFPRAEHGRVVSRFYVAAPLATVAMGAMSGALLGLDGVARLHGWQWLFLVQGTPSVLVGLVVLRWLPPSPNTADWLTRAERRALAEALAADERRIGAPVSHDIRSAMTNPRVLLLGLVGILCIGAQIAFTLSAPAVLAQKTGLDVTHVGYLIGAGGVTGALGMLAAGWMSDRSGDRFLVCAAWLVLLAAAVLAIALAASPIVAIVAYLVFGAGVFTVLMLAVVIWTEVLHIRLLAVGTATINTISQIGGFAAPYAWGVAKDATGSYHAGLLALPAAYLVAAAVVMLLRGHVIGQRRARGQPQAQAV
jgi:ACS family tartrate transporter-like MFS transporter